jgi:hypothetical protein
MSQQLLLVNDEPLAPTFLVGWLLRHFADETVHIRIDDQRTLHWGGAIVSGSTSKRVGFLRQ